MSTRGTGGSRSRCRRSPRSRRTPVPTDGCARPSRAGETSPWGRGPTAVEACRESEDPYLVSYALGRRAEAEVAGSDRAAAIADAARVVAAGPAAGRDPARDPGRAARPACAAGPGRPRGRR